MYIGLHRYNFNIALLFWSAMFLCSCSSGVQSDVVVSDKASTPSIKTTNLTMRTYSKGKLSSQFNTKLLEKYDFAQEPYMEFSQGVHIITFNDSTFQQESELTADYAKYLDKYQLWEAKGNVVVKTVDGKTVFTEHAFFDEIRDSIYSNVDTKVVTEDDVLVGSGFFSDGKLKDIILLETRARMFIDTTKRTLRDSTVVDSM